MARRVTGVPNCGKVGEKDAATKHWQNIEQLICSQRYASSERNQQVTENGQCEATRKTKQTKAQKTPTPDQVGINHKKHVSKLKQYHHKRKWRKLGPRHISKVRRQLLTQQYSQDFNVSDLKEQIDDSVISDGSVERHMPPGKLLKRLRPKKRSRKTYYSIGGTLIEPGSDIDAESLDNGSENEESASSIFKSKAANKESVHKSQVQNNFTQTEMLCSQSAAHMCDNISQSNGENFAYCARESLTDICDTQVNQTERIGRRIPQDEHDSQVRHFASLVKYVICDMAGQKTSIVTDVCSNINVDDYLTDAKNSSHRSCTSCRRDRVSSDHRSFSHQQHGNEMCGGNFGTAHCHIGSTEKLQVQDCSRKAHPVPNPTTQVISRCCCGHCHKDSTNMCANTHSKHSPLSSLNGQSQNIAAYQKAAHQKNSAFEPSATVIMKCCCDHSQYGRVDLCTGNPPTLSFDPLQTQHSEYGVAQANSTMTHQHVTHQKKTPSQTRLLISSFEANTPSPTSTEASAARNCSTPAASQLSAGGIAPISPLLGQHYCSRSVSHQNQRCNIQSSAVVNHAQINLPWHLAHFPIPQVTTPVSAVQGICAQPLDLSTFKMNTTNTSHLPTVRNVQPGQSVLHTAATTSAQRFQEFRRPEPICSLQTQHPENKQHSSAGKGSLEELQNINTDLGHSCASKGICNKGLMDPSTSVTLSLAEKASQEKLHNCNVAVQHCSASVDGGLCRVEPQDTSTFPCASEADQVMQQKSKKSVVAPQPGNIPASHDSSLPTDKSFVNCSSSHTYQQIMRGRGKDRGRYAWAITLQAEDEDLFGSQNVTELNQMQELSSNTDIAVEHNENHSELEMEVESAVDQSVDASRNEMAAKERSSHVNSQKTNEHQTQEEQLECLSDRIQEVTCRSPSLLKEGLKRIGKCPELQCAMAEGPQEKRSKFDDSKCIPKDTQYDAPQISEELSRKTRSLNSNDSRTKEVQTSNMGESDRGIVFEELDQSDINHHQSEGKLPSVERRDKTVDANLVNMCTEEGSPHLSKQQSEEEQDTSDVMIEEEICESPNAPKQEPKRIGECAGVKCVKVKDLQRKKQQRSSNTKDMKTKKGQKSKKGPSKVKSKAAHASTPVDHEKEHFSPSLSEGKLQSGESKTCKTSSKEQQDNTDNTNMNDSDCEMMFEELDPTALAHIMLVLRQQELLLQKENGGSVTSPSDQRLLFRKLKAAQLPRELQALRVLCARKNWSSPPQSEKISALKLLEQNLKEKSQEEEEEEGIVEMSCAHRKALKKKKVSPHMTRMRPLPVCFLKKKGTPEEEPRVSGGEIDSKQITTQVSRSDDTSPTGTSDNKGKSRREAIRGAKRQLDLPTNAGKELIKANGSKMPPEGHESNFQNVEKPETSPMADDKTTRACKELSPPRSSVVLAKRNWKSSKTRGKSHDAKTLEKSSPITESLTLNTAEHQSEKLSPSLSPGLKSCPNHPSVPATSLQSEERSGNDCHQNSFHDWTVQLKDRQRKEKERWLNSQEENSKEDSSTSSPEPSSPVVLTNDSLQSIQGKADLVGDATVTEVALAHDIASHVILDHWRNVRSVKSTKRFVYPMYDKKVVLGALWDLRNNKDTAYVTNRILSLQWKNVHPVAFHTLISMFVSSLSRLSAYHVERYNVKGSSVGDGNSSSEENQTIRPISTPLVAVASRLILKGEWIEGMDGLLLEVNDDDAANLRKWCLHKFSCGRCWTILGPIAYLGQHKHSNAKLCVKNAVQVFAQATCDIPIGQQIFTTYSSIEKNMCSWFIQLEEIFCCKEAYPID